VSSGGSRIGRRRSAGGLVRVQRARPGQHRYRGGGRAGARSGARPAAGQRVNGTHFGGIGGGGGPDRDLVDDTVPLAPGSPAYTTPHRDRRRLRQSRDMAAPASSQVFGVRSVPNPEHQALKPTVWCSGVQGAAAAGAAVAVSVAAGVESCAQRLGNRRARGRQRRGSRRKSESGCS
jgi:hypothetical protein